MPPKKQDKGQQKAEEKRKAKIVEDKTFGLKNKNKSKAVQKYIRSVQQQVTGGKMKSEVQIAQEEHEKKELKKAQQKQAALLAALTKGTENMKKIAGNDPELDPKQIRDGQLIDVYVDQREQRKQESMDDWDQAKLEQVVKTKHGGQKPTTDIVCRFFLDALEKRLYGWFWQCPNGEACQYKHCLPPGYVLKKKEIDPTELEVEDEPIEEIIERERAALPLGSGTPVTLETFLAWKQRKREEAERAAEEVKKERGRMDMSGRDLFTFNPALFVDDAEAADSQEYVEDEEYQRERLANDSDGESSSDSQEEDDDDDDDDDEDENPGMESTQADDKPETSSLQGAEQTNFSTTSTAVKNPHLFLQNEDEVNLDDLDD
eukprot:Gregarina_sp_Pseudo_9__5341@NODE_634_length_2451_cov_12_395522_g598_i0_p1_GENE_NODE_634_length_2451_cov_12_395522_g598_i0NODE_634_length_2451_cov_12_395522_g598_i0_p1_ORF_typecomplete_len375_score102_80DFRP_C/PF16543_5/1_8e04DFRP_C/PF16543_5/9_6e03DFRP_C/PF16543_5/1_7e17zfCCCH_2/PF14608_6/0_00423H/PF02829_14/0_13zfCCCH/PF00642_24/0_33zfCCCH_4/PF18044_1/0_44_NODE_634_length_2451_cov_12_395522_g598_i0691193